MDKIPFVYTEENDGTPVDKKETENTIRLIADRILKNTSYQFIDRNTNATYRETDNMPVADNIVLESGYNDWKYWNGVIHLAMMQIGQTFSDQKYIDYVRENYRFAFKHLDYFRKLYDEEIYNANFHQFFRLDRLDDFGAMASGLLEVLKYESNPQYTDYIEKVANYILKKQDRLEDGIFCRNRFGKTTLWADDLYMSVPFLARMWKKTGNETFLRDAVNQVKLFNEHLYNEKNGLFYHCWYKELNQHGVAFWGRANGWVIMGQTELMNFLPDDHPDREMLSELLFSQIVGISRYQSANGLWRQLLDKTDSFHETSSTAMFVYGIAKAVNEGWIDDIYSSVAINGWKRLVKNVTVKGELLNVSTGFNIRQDLPYYYNRPIEKGGDHGVGALLLAGTEIYKMKEYRNCVWC